MLKNNEKGRSMIEMLGVLGIIGVLSVGGIAGYSKAMSKFRINKTADQVSQLAQNIRTLFSSQRNYRSLYVDVIKRAHLAPDDMFESTYSGTLTNPFGGYVNVYPSGKTYNDDGKAFVIEYHDIPQEACIDLVTQNWGTGSSSGLIAISGNSSLNSAHVGCTSEGGSEFCADRGVMNMGAALSACGNTTSNTIYWKFF